MDPLLICLLAAAWLTHLAKEVPYTVRGKTSPRMQLRLDKARAARTVDQGRPARRAARDFFSALWADAWDDAHGTRQRMRARRAVNREAGTLWRQHARRGLSRTGRAAWQHTRAAAHRARATGHGERLPGLDDPVQTGEPHQVDAEAAPADRYADLADRDLAAALVADDDAEDRGHAPRRPAHLLHLPVLD